MSPNRCWARRGTQSTILKQKRGCSLDADAAHAGAEVRSPGAFWDSQNRNVCFPPTERCSVVEFQILRLGIPEAQNFKDGASQATRHYPCKVYDHLPLTPPSHDGENFRDPACWPTDPVGASTGMRIPISR